MIGGLTAFLYPAAAVWHNPGDPMASNNTKADETVFTPRSPLGHSIREGGF
jgi:hypothetical protein